MELLGEIGRGVNAAFAQADGANAALSSGTFTVTRDNVLAAAKIIYIQAESLQVKLEDARRQLRIVPPGDDDVSTRMAAAWNDLLVDDENSYAERIWLYIRGLKNLADQCRESAKAYGYTDDQIAAAFGAQSG